MNTEHKSHAWSPEKMKEAFAYKNITWWVLLATAVLVVPSLAYTFTTMVHISGGSEVLIFVVSCWICVYIGLQLMKTPRINSIMFEHIAISEQTRQRCINMISMIENEVGKWKKRYEKCEGIFMNLSRQPAWNYLDEITQLLGSIKQSAEQNANIGFNDIKALERWNESSKPSVVEGYLHSLEAAYGYAKAEYAQQGKNIEEAFPELGKGHIETFLKSPAYATGFARELWGTLEKEHPMLGRAAMAKPYAKVA
jgi:hypothetical protein